MAKNYWFWRIWKQGRIYSSWAFSDIKLVGRIYLPGTWTRIRLSRFQFFKFSSVFGSFIQKFSDSLEQYLLMFCCIWPFAAISGSWVIFDIRKSGRIGLRRGNKIVSNLEHTWKDPEMTPDGPQTDFHIISNGLHLDPNGSPTSPHRTYQQTHITLSKAHRTSNWIPTDHHRTPQLSSMEYW